MPVPPSAEPTGPFAPAAGMSAKARRSRPKPSHCVAHIAIDQRRGRRSGMSASAIRSKTAIGSIAEALYGRPAPTISRIASKTCTPASRSTIGPGPSVAQGAPRLAASVKKLISECGGRSGSSTLPSPRQLQHLVPARRRMREQRPAARPGPGWRHRSATPIAGPARYSSGRTGRRSPLASAVALRLAAGNVERRQAAFRGDLADMRMVDDDQVVARAPAPRPGRIRSPAASACPSRSRRRSSPAQSARAGDHRVVAARMAPGHALERDASQAELLRGSPRSCSPIRGAARSDFGRRPSTRSGERVVRIEHRHPRASTVCSMSSTWKPSLSISSGQVSTLAHQMSAGSRMASHSSIVCASRCCWAMIALISSRAVNQVAGWSR